MTTENKAMEEQEPTPEICEQAIVVSNGTVPKLQPHDIEVFAQYAIDSGLFKDVKTMAQAYIKVWAGQELGLPPAYSMRSLYWIETKDGHSHIGMTANVIATLIKKSKRYDYRIKEMTDTRCSIVFYEKQQELGTYTYTTQDAKKANLLGKPTWVGYTRDMLFNRAMSLGANKFCPDVKLGYLTVEEIQNIDSLDIDNPPTPVDSKTASVATTASTDGIKPLPSTNPLVDAAKQAGAVEIPNFPKLNEKYGVNLDFCWLHDNADWKSNKFGKLSHKTQDGWCNFNEVLKPIVAELAKAQGWDAGTMTDILKEKYEGRTWSKLSEEEQCLFLESLIMEEKGK